MGTQIRKDLEGDPYGWPRDAVDAALIALHRSQNITATLNGVPLAVGQLDQNKIAKAEFRIEKTTLTVGDRTALRALFQDLGIKTKSEELDAKAPEFFAALLALAAKAGGEAPAPAPPDPTHMEDIYALVGNDRLAKLKERATAIKANIAEWKQIVDLMGRRWPSWKTLERLAAHARSLDTAAEAVEECDAIRANRRLLAEPDLIAPLRATIADLLRQALNTLSQVHQKAYQEAIEALEANDTWLALSPSDQDEILREVGLRAPVVPELSNDDTLLAALDSQTLAARQAQVDAIAGREAKALQLAAQRLEPEVQFISLERAVLKTPDDVEAWLGRQRDELLNAIQQGPVQIQ
jgi:hypothetical protein